MLRIPKNKIRVLSSAKNESPDFYNCSENSTKSHGFDQATAGRPGFLNVLFLIVLVLIPDRYSPGTTRPGFEYRERTVKRTTWGVAILEALEFILQGVRIEKNSPWYYLQWKAKQEHEQYPRDLSIDRLSLLNRHFARRELVFHRFLPGYTLNKA